MKNIIACLLAGLWSVLVVNTQAWAESAPNTPVAAPAVEIPAAVKTLIAQMSSEKFEEREAATKALSALPSATVKVLEAALAQSTDLEVNKRLELLIERLRADATMAQLTEGMTKTPSGLSFKELRPGKGEMPGVQDNVSVHYRGLLTNGKEFDSSYKRGEPSTFALTSVIKGWTEGLQKMQPGGKYVLVIPPDLAYGEAGAGEMIPANATLIFEVELIKIDRKAP